MREMLINSNKTQYLVLSGNISFTYKTNAHSEITFEWGGVAPHVHVFSGTFWFFSAPEPKAQVRYCDHVMSVVRPSVVNFSHFQLLLWNHWTEFNKTWQEARSQRPLPSLCFSGRSEKQDGRPGLWLAETFSTSPLKPLNGIQRNLIGSKISTSSTKFVFFWADRKKQDGRPGLWLAETFSTFPLKPLNGIQRN